MTADDPVVSVRNIEKTFVLHLRDGAHLPVVRHASFDVYAGECVALDGPSGAGKSSILKMIYGNYRLDAGAILIRDHSRMVDLATADPRQILHLRRTAIGYVSQFLRTIPRVSCLDLVTANARRVYASPETARESAMELLERLNLPERLWSLPPATFSGGEQQRVNIACGFAAQHPIMLLDEPTASLDTANAEVVLDLIAERRAHGAAVIGIFHDPRVRSRICDRLIDVRAFAPEVDHV